MTSMDEIENYIKNQKMPIFYEFNSTTKRYEVNLNDRYLVSKDNKLIPTAFQKFIPENDYLYYTNDNPLYGHPFVYVVAI
jgi:hypothetical protein